MHDDERYVCSVQDPPHHRDRTVGQEDRLRPSIPKRTIGDWSGSGDGLLLMIRTGLSEIHVYWL
jgi:hypothetical protein